MKETLASKTLRYSVYGFITIAAVLVVLGLGFMTNFYPLFYDGTSDMYDFYKSVQALNKAMFNGSIVIIVLSVLMIGFDINKKKHGPVGTIYTIIVAAYTMMTGLIIQRAVPYYKSIYTAFDFAEVKNYTPSYWIFNFTQVVFALAMFLSVLIAVLAIVRYVQSLKNKEVLANE